MSSNLTLGVHDLLVTRHGSHSPSKMEYVGYSVDRMYRGKPAIDGFVRSIGRMVAYLAVLGHPGSDEAYPTGRMEVVNTLLDRGSADIPDGHPAPLGELSGARPLAGRMRNYTIGRIWDIPIRINTSLLIFLPILAWLIGSGQQIELYAGLIETTSGVGFDLRRLRSGSMSWVIGIIAAVGLFVSVTLHELGHSWVALRYDIEIESITLWILGGIASLKTIPREWNREFWIAIAGPITSVLIGLGCYAGLLLTPEALQVPRFIIGYLAVTNVILAGFNLLPAFPMDGGRILRALLARSRPYGSATRIAGRIGVIFAFLFAVVGVLQFQLMLILLALFIYGAATTESRAVLLDELFEGVTVGDIMTRDPVRVSAEMTVADLGDQMLRDRQTVHPVTDDDGSVLGVIALDDLKTIRADDWGTSAVRTLTREVPSVASTADALDTMALLAEFGASDALVADDDELIGILSESDFATALSIRRGF